MTYPAMAAELEKIADTLGAKEKKRVKDLEEGKRPFLTRAFTAAAGGSMAAAALPLTAKAVSPDPIGYHGTTMGAAHSILNIPDEAGRKGLFTRYAGKAGRLNEKMLSNALIEAAELQGVKLTDGEIVRFVMDTNDRISTMALAANNPARYADKVVDDLKYLSFYPSAQKTAFYEKLSKRNGALKVDILKKVNEFYKQRAVAAGAAFDPLKAADIFSPWRDALSSWDIEYAVRQRAGLQYGAAGDLGKEVGAFALALPENGALSRSSEVRAFIKYESVPERAAMWEGKGIHAWTTRARKGVLKRIGAIKYDSTVVVEDAARELLRSKVSPNLSPEEARKAATQTERTIQSLRVRLKERGKRIYFGWHPSTVAVWGSTGSEMDLYAQKILGEFLESSEGKGLLTNVEARMAKYAPPGTKLPKFPSLHRAEGAKDVIAAPVKWLGSIIEAASLQTEKNIAAGMSPKKAGGRLHELLDVDADDLYKVMSGKASEAEQRRMSETIGKRARKLQSGERLWGKDALAKDLKDFSKDVERGMEKFYKKKAAKAGITTATFGVVEEAKNLASVVTYRPQKTSTMTLEAAAAHVAELHKGGSKAQVVIGAHLPAGSLRWMTDFPFLSGLMAINPGLKYSVSEFLPNFDPSRDLSVATDVPAERFKVIDIVDGKDVHRIKIKGGGQRAPFKAAQYLRGVGRILPYAGVGLLGFDLAQSSIRNKKTWVEQAFAGELQLRPSKKNPLVRRWQKAFPKKKALSKAAAAYYWAEIEKIGFKLHRPAIKSFLSTSKYTLPAVGVGAGVGFGVEGAVEKVMPSSRSVKMKEPKKTAYLGSRTLATTLGIIGAGAAFAGLLGRKSMKRIIKLSKTESGTETQKFGQAVGATLAAVGVTYLGIMAASTAASSTDQVRRGMPAHAISPLNLPFAHPKMKKKTKKLPQIAAAPSLAALAVAAPLAVYAGRRYYPGHSLIPKTFLRKGEKAWTAQIVDPAGVGTAKYLRKKGLPSYSTQLSTRRAKKYG